MTTITTTKLWTAETVDGKTTIRINTEDLGKITGRNLADPTNNSRFIKHLRDNGAIGGTITPLPYKYPTDPAWTAIWSDRADSPDNDPEIETKPMAPRLPKLSTKKLPTKTRRF